MYLQLFGGISMKVTSSGIHKGIIDDIYGKRSHHKRSGMPTYSLPLEIEGEPAGTVSYAIILEDKDAVPVCGYSWIHWTVANLTRKSLKENESATATDFVQGATSESGKLVGLDRYETSCYAGMSPPNAPHVYEIHVFALDCLLDLKKGFYMNELWKAMEGHILDQFTLKGTYIN
jgi:Raf kinase inhibitor-like YbhB/YbcL family protein